MDMHLAWILDSVKIKQYAQIIPNFVIMQISSESQDNTTLQLPMYNICF